MRAEVGFVCSGCGVKFPVVLKGDRFACPGCGRGFRLVQCGRRWGWMEDGDGPSWMTKTVRPVAENFFIRKQEQPESHTNVGAARARQLYRQQRSGASGAKWGLLVALALFGCLLAYPLHSRASSERAAEAGKADHAPGGPVIGTPTETALPGSPTAAPTATPAATPNPTDVPSRTPTATTLPPGLAAATAWQATLEVAIYQSFAVQTRYAENYLASQTALPPVWTELAAGRQAATTQTAVAKQARGRP